MKVQSSNLRAKNMAFTEKNPPRKSPYGEASRPLGLPKNTYGQRFGVGPWPGGPSGTLRVPHGTKIFGPKIFFYQPHMMCIYVIF